MRAVAIAVLVLLILPLPARAQDEAGKQLLKGWSGYDEALALTTHLGVYLKGKNIGQSTLEIGKGPPSSPAVYRLALKMKIKIGSQLIEGDETQLLDEKLSLISRVNVETVRKGQLVQSKTITIRKVAAEWSCTVKRRTNGKGDDASCTGTDEGPDHWESALLLARKLPRQPGTYVLRGTEWPAWPTRKGGEAPRLEPSDITITVPPAKRYQHRGKAVQAHPITFARGEADTLVVVVDAAGRLLATWAVGRPIKLVVGTREECQRDLPSLKSLKGQPIEPVMTYFKVVFKTLPIDALDGVMDWTALRAEAGKVEVDLDVFRRDLKDQFKKQAAPAGKEALEFLPRLLKTKITGDTAKVYLENRRTDVFRLKRAADGKWRIIHFPH